MPSEKYIPGKQCPKLQEYVVWLGQNRWGYARQSGQKIGNILGNNFWTHFVSTS